MSEEHPQYITREFKPTKIPPEVENFARVLAARLCEYCSNGVPLVTEGMLAYGGMEYVHKFEGYRLRLSCRAGSVHNLLREMGLP